MTGILKTLLPPALWVVLLLLVATAARQETLGPKPLVCGSPGLLSGPVDASPPVRVTSPTPS